ncbi:microtubule-associated protein futsch-like [Anopheles bellator]|uniref:microtubule-associated protein futsch-like n=1 Tax=Anopheles bellator TaxID=139047 RepID=UPI00264918F0|nr:microtubule-associated protein futsch-like [Anopheles bellator]
MDPTASQQAAETEQPEAADSGETDTPTGEAIVSSSDPEVERQSSEVKESNVQKESASQSDCSSTHEKTNPDASEAQQDNEEPCLIESSSEKSSPEKFKEDELKSPPELEVFSIEEEEDEEGEEVEEEEEEAGVEETVGAVEDYLEMDEDDEMFVESTDRIGANESIDNDLSTDEYTDDEKRSADKRDSKKRKSSDEDTDDDDDVQRSSSLGYLRPGRYSCDSDSNSDGFVVERKLKKRYDDYTSKLVATVRKRAIKVLHKRKRMHVMEESGSSGRFLMCADGALYISTPTLKPALGSPKAGCKPESPQQQRPPPTESSEKTRDEASPATTTDDSHQNKAKDTEEEAAQRRPQVIEQHSDSDQFTISSTIDDATGDKMPTATAAMEDVSERIADSSDDGLSTLSSKKSITAATTPTVNSSASTAEPPSQSPTPETGGQPEKKESSDASPSPKETVPSETESNSKAVGKDASERGPSVTVAESQPTADDVMEGIDDFMDHNGSSGDGEGKDDFNDDLTFQMDVDEGSMEKPKEKSESAAVVQESKALANAIDLTSSSGSQSNEDLPPNSEDGKEAAPEVAEQPSNAIDSVDSVAAKDQPLADPSPPPPRATENAKDATSTVVTSTPVATSVRQKRGDDAEVQVKNEQDEAAGTDEVQNLSKAKPLARSSTISDEVQQPTAKGSARSEPAEPANRKRRRSVNDEEEEADRAATESDDPIEPAKKLKLEVDSHYRAHERVVKEYIDTTPNTSVDEIQSTTDLLVKEIQSLNDEIRDTERKWNELLHLKKVKEEILLRLNRRKHVLSITETRLGEVSAYNHVDSSNFSNQHEQQQQQQQNHHQQHQGQRSSSVGPRLPTPPPEVEIRPASVTITPTNYSATTNGGTFADKPGTGYNGNKLISNRRSSSIVSQFNNSNNAVTMVPLHNSTTSMILNARANMNKAEIARDKSMAEQIQRHILPKPVLSNHQQILNNLAISAGLTASGGNATVRILRKRSEALQNGHHSTSSAAAASAAAQLHHQQQLQIGRQGMRKDVSSIIADYRQKHPENVPRRGRRLKNVPSSTGNNNGGNSIAASFGDGGAISLTALSGGKSPGVRSNSVSADVANRISELMAAAETSRPSSNDSSQSGSNLLSSLVSAGAGGSGTSTTTGQQFLKEVLAQFAKMSQNEQCLLSNLQLLTNNLSASGANTVSSPQQSPQNLQQQHSSQQHHHQQQQLQSGGTKTSLPEVTLHPVMNSTAHSDTVLGSHNSSLAGVNLSAVGNTSTNSLLHGILTKSASRPAGAAAAVGAAVAANFNSFSPTLARLLTAPERMGSQTQTSSTVTSGALASLHHPGGSVVSGLNLSKNNNEISITPVLAPNMQQTLLAQQQQQLADQQKQLQRLRDHHLFKGEPYLNLDDEADDSADRLVIDEGDDMMMGRGDSRRRGAEINENEVPQCQGCKRMEAKFVCAGCSNQWYCSRACQVKAWDDHSEVCCCD